ncbi:MAG TPA: hypothetical protein VIQ11_09275 [Mycobacterium sp.]
MKNHAFKRVAGAAALTASALGAMGSFAVLTASAADAKPMEHDNKRYCAKINSDLERTGALYMDALSKYGRDDRLTLQAASNLERAENAWVASSC